MAKIRDLLDSIEQDVHAVRVADAQTRLEALIGELGVDEVLQWQVEILRVIESFHAKRKRALTAAFQARQKKLKLLPVEEEVAFVGGDLHVDRALLQETLEDELSRLAQFHIFQWSTYYRDWAENFLEAQLRPETRLAGDLIRSVIGAHITEIFERGFRYKTEDQGKAETLAHLTAVSGLQRFSELAVEFYAGAAMKRTRPEDRSALRAGVSSYLGAALIGFAKSDFGGRTGAELLATHPTLWFHYLPFMRLEEIAYLTESLGLGRASLMLSELGRPLACVLDTACGSQGSYLPHISQYFHAQRKLEIVLHSPKATDGGRAEILVLMDADVVEVSYLKQAEARDVQLVLAALKPDVATAPIAERIQHVLVNVKEPGLSSSEIDGRATSVLMEALSRLQPTSDLEALLEYNFARNFPLSNPFQSKYFHVVRGSVRNLLRELEGINGVKLWCSVRRSGKTTACFDLSGALPSSDVVVQTCDTTRADDLSNRLFDSITGYLGSSQPLPKTFVRDIVEELRPGGSPKARVVVILDEYETLFGRLRAADRTDPDLRFTVIYPLLGQLVAFAQENMLVFVGQQPNAHFILMEQNPLSAYVKQDSFPLFSHHKNSRNDEFSELVSKVLPEKYSYTNRFLDHLFAETGGHPFLTVNVLVSCVEWMISCRTRRVDVKFDENLWDRFAKSELHSTKIAINTEYQFFIEAASEAMSDHGLNSSPWLWAIYRSLREFASKFGAGNDIATEEFISMYNFNSIQRCGVSAEEVLRTGADTNFLKIDVAGRVSIRIPVLARIAAASSPRLH